MSIQERIQNLVDELTDWKLQNLTWEVTEKLDGCSMTAYLINDKFGVCSRNYDLKENEKNSLCSISIICRSLFCFSSCITRSLLIIGIE